MPSPSSAQPTFVGTVADARAMAVDLLFVPVFEDDSLDDLPDIDRATGGALGRARQSGEFRPRSYELFIASVIGGGWAAARLVFVGAGTRRDADAERTRRIAAV
jgi:hypothetical protein